MEYPKRDPHFAIRYLHAVNDAEIVQRVGKGAALLVQMIALREDRLRYSEPPKFWRAELMRFLGIVSPKDFQRVRDRAVEAGLLHVQRGNKRQVTTYWVLIADWMRHRFPNEQSGQIVHVKTAESISSQNGTNGVGISSQNGTDAAISSPISSLISSRISSLEGTLSIPIPDPKEEENIPGIVPAVLAGSASDSDKPKAKPKRTKPAPLPTPGFEQFWAAYPRKEGKQDALKAYPKAIAEIGRERQASPDDAAAWLLERVKDYDKSKQGEERRFFKQPSAWLNGKRWDDELDTAAGRSSLPASYRGMKCI